MNISCLISSCTRVGVRLCAVVASYLGLECLGMRLVVWSNHIPMSRDPTSQNLMSLAAVLWGWHLERSSQKRRNSRYVNFYVRLEVQKNLKFVTISKT